MIERDAKKIELLAPAGDFDCLRAAVNAGADAVYLGIGPYSARRRAVQFKGELLRRAIEYAHLRSVLVYGALNIIVREDELEDVASIIQDACSAGVDALIVQDWGIARMAREIFPDVRLHGSTQINAHNLPMIEILRKKGFTRATVARELSVDEVSRLAASGFEIEVFAHGALCFSYSGQCLISSMVSGRSGNRGLCPQVCRFAYEVVGKGRPLKMPGKHPISTKDLCTLSMLSELRDAGVASIKIEGRLKSDDYVATVTSIYRRAMDRMYAGGALPAGEEDLRELKLAFNRGFTQGYLAGVKDERLMSFHRPSDRGVMIGRVAFADVYSGKVGVTLQGELKTGDVVEVWVSKGGRIRQRVGDIEVDGRATNEAEPGSRAVFRIAEMRHRIATGDRVFIVGREIVKPEEKRLPLKMAVKAREGMPLEVRAESGGVSIDIAGSVAAEKARTRPLTLESLERQLGKLGGTAYRLADLKVDITGDPLVPVSEINDIRRRTVAEMDRHRLASYKKTCKSADIAKLRAEQPVQPAEPQLWATVSAPEASTAALHAGADLAFIKLSPPYEIDDELAEAVLEAEGKVRPAIGNIAKDSEAAVCVAALDRLWRKGLVSVDNVGLAYILASKGYDVALDYRVNLLNSIACNELADLATCGLTISVEASEGDIKEMAARSKVPLAVVVHGRIEVMTAEHPIVNVPKDEREGACYEIADPKDFRFPAVIDGAGRTHIYNSKELCLLEELPRVLAAGVRDVRLLLELYRPDEVERIVSTYRSALDEFAATRDVSATAARAASAHFSFADHTTGRFYRPVL